MDNTAFKQAIIARLPKEIGARVQSAKIADAPDGAILTLVMEAGGLGEKGRTKLEDKVRSGLAGMDDISDIRIAMVADRAAPPPRPRIIAVGSGKGGVGKSTLTANLAIALKRSGLKVGVVDADVYGPSQPTLLATKGEKPEAHDDKLEPVVSKYGIPMLSMGHLVEPGKALAWRGPMAGNAMGQLVDAHWGDTEILLIDLPPGTGDVQLTMLQKYKPEGAVIVSTPQDLALIDAQRAANLFDSGKVPIIGLVENMSGYACPHCGEVSDPFGRGGVEAASDATDIPFLGRIPLAMKIREESDAGNPVALGDSEEAQAFLSVANSLKQWLADQAA